MANEFKLAVVHFARPNTMQICACAQIYRWTKKLWKIRTGPTGLRAAGLWGRGLAFSKTLLSEVCMIKIVPHSTVSPQM